MEDRTVTRFHFTIPMSDDQARIVADAADIVRDRNVNWAIAGSDDLHFVAVFSRVSRAVAANEETRTLALSFAVDLARGANKDRADIGYHTLGFGTYFGIGPSGIKVMSLRDGDVDETGIAVSTVLRHFQMRDLVFTWLRELEIGEPDGDAMRTGQVRCQGLWGHEHRLAGPWQSEAESARNAKANRAGRRPTMSL